MHKIISVKKHLILILILFPLFGFSQLDISITSNIVPLYTSDGDTLSACRKDTIYFYAEVTDGGVPVTGAYYEWDLDYNEVKPFGTDVDSIMYIYSEGGGYRVKLKVTKDADEWFTILPIKIAVEPNYSETKVSIPEEHDGICLGSSAPLLGKAFPEFWEDEPVYNIDEGNDGNFFEFNDNYTSTLPFDEFPIDAVFSSGNIDSIGIEILHADMGDLQITLSCENSSVVLKNYDASNHALLGDTTNGVNEPYTYYWSSSASITMNSATTLNNIVPASAYLPDGNFDALIGCPLNSDWTIEINDNQEFDSGYVHSWTIIFQEDVLPDIWTFKDTLIQYKDINGIPYPTYWSGLNAGVGSVIKIGDTITANTLASPDTYQNHTYKFHVITNWGCPQDTSVKLLVEEPLFTINKEDVLEFDTITFTDETSWAYERDWDFNDKNTGYRITDTITHFYEEKKLEGYEVVLTATDNNGCTDTDTMIIIVDVEPTKLENIPNMFSPAKPVDRDGINDFFRISDKSLAGMDKFRIRIYNRWGDKVFESTSVQEMNDEGWDGTIMNRGIMLASPGIYFYVIEADGKDKLKYIDSPKKNLDKVDLERYKPTDWVRGTIHLFR